MDFGLKKLTFSQYQLRQVNQWVKQVPKERRLPLAQELRTLSGLRGTDNPVLRKALELLEKEDKEDANILPEDGTGNPKAGW